MRRPAWRSGVLKSVAAEKKLFQIREKLKLELMA